VAEPRDLDAIERTGIYRGLYHVLDGLLSPLDGIGPRELSIEQLLHRIQDNKPEEILMALSSTIEGDATTSYIIDLLKPTGISITRLARGVPAGGSLEYLDTRTLSQALTGREYIVEQ
jgi:recombination protein RecR